MKKIIALLMILALCACLLISCGGNTETESKPAAETPTESQTESRSESESETENNTPSTTVYTVKLVDIYGNAIPMAALKIGSKSFITNAQGEASAELATDNYTVTIVMAKDYIYETSYAFPEGINTLIITLEKQGTDEDDLVNYTVKVVDGNGNGIEGVTLQLCQGACNLMPATDANGISSKALVEKEYNVQILSADGYVVPEGYIAIIPVGQNEITITLEAIG